MQTITRRVLRLSFLAAFVTLAGCPLFGPKPAVGVIVVEGNGQTAVAGSFVAKAPKIKVIDEDSAGVGGGTFHFTVTGGTGTVSVASGVVGKDGMATAVKWTLGKTMGANTLDATVDGVVSTATFTATGTAGPATTSTVNAGNNQTAGTGTAVAIAPSVKVVDANDNLVTGATVTFSVTAGGGSITGGTATTTSAGIATVGSWTLGSTAGTNTLSAQVTGIANAVVFTATATPVATKVVIGTQPGNAVTGQALGTQPVITIRDASNSIVTASTASVTAAIASGTGTLTGTTTVAAVAGTATFTNLVVTGTSAVTMAFSSTGLTSATSNSFTPTATGGFNLLIDGMHLTQATQTYTGTVPIIANRAALVRVFVVASATNTSQPTVKVTTYQGGTLFKTYTINAPLSTTPLSADESALSTSWNVVIPANEVVANMSVLAEVDPTNTITEASETDNKFPANGTPLTLDVKTVPAMKITFIPVTQGGGTGDITTTNLSAYLDFPKRVYPWADVDAVIATPYVYATTLNGASYDAGWSTLLSEISAKRTTDGVTDRYYYAVIKPSYSSGGTGFGQVGGAAAIGVDVKFNGTVAPNTNYYSMTIAHEIGHNFGRQHVNCGSPANPDASYPYNPTTSIGTYGYDPLFAVLRGKDSFTDFMSYCNPLWISDYTYKAVITWRSTHFGPTGTTARKSLLVWGRIGPSGVVLEPAFEVDAPVSLPERAGRYSVEAVDDAGQRVFNLSFEGYEVDHAPGERNFAFTVPLPTSGTISELRLRDGSQIMTRRSRASLTPVAAPEALASMRLRTLGGPRSRLEWNAQTFPMAMVRDPITGEVIGFLRGGAGDVGTQRTEVDVLFSNGVTSVKKRVPIGR